MRSRLALALGVAVLAIAGLAGQQGVPPPTVPPPIPPTTTPVGPTRTFGPRPSGWPMPSDAAVIIGQVVDNTGRGVPKTAVRLIGAKVIETVLTDARGRFFFRSIPPGEAIVTARKFGFFDGAYGMRRATGQPLPFALAQGQVITDMRIEMFRGAVITGSVVDEVGEPVVGARVVAMRRQFAGGRWQYAAVSSELTDDEGFYRIFDLPPAEYIVTTPSTLFSAPAEMLDSIGATARAGGGIAALILGGAQGDTGAEKTAFIGSHARITSDGRDVVWTNGASPPDDNGRDGVYPIQFYPATQHQILALPLTLAPGDVRYAVNFQLSLVPVRRVTGRLVGAPGTVSNQLVRLVPVDSDSTLGDDAAATVSEIDGAFAFRRVPPGRYRLEAGNLGSMIRSAIGDPADVATAPPKTYWARADVSVTDGDVDALNVSMRQTVALQGRVAIDRAVGSREVGIPIARVPITIEPADPGLPGGAAMRLTSSGEFLATNIVPGNYLVRVGVLPPGWFLKSVTAAGHNAIDDPVEVGDGGESSVVVTLTTRGTEVSGSVRDARMQAVAGATVIVMPVTTSGDVAWTPNRTREARASTSGVFFVNGLPPGDYLFVAIDDAVAEGWQDPRVMATLRTLATRIALRDGESRALNLRLSPLRR